MEKEDFYYYKNRSKDENNKTVFNNRRLDLTKLNLKILKRLGKHDLMMIILQREERINSINNDFLDKLKNNDREVFLNLKTHINFLQDKLLKENAYYRAYIEIREELEKYKGLYEMKTEKAAGLKRSNDILKEVINKN